MAYQSMASLDGSPSLREKGTVDVVDEGARLIDNDDGSRTDMRLSRRSRKGAALALLVLAVGAISAFSSMGGRKTTQGEYQIVVPAAHLTLVFLGRMITLYEDCVTFVRRFVITAVR